MILDPPVYDGGFWAQNLMMEKKIRKMLLESLCAAFKEPLKANFLTERKSSSSNLESGKALDIMESP